jgi:hypothetical protein
MKASDTAVQWAKHWLYDWGGANVDLFLAIQRTLPDGWTWLPELLSALGSYWGAPAVVVLLLVWRRVQVAEAASLTVSLVQFVLGLALAITAAAVAKAVFALPRPFVVLGDAVYRAVSAPDSRYTHAQWPLGIRRRPGGGALARIGLVRQNWLASVRRCNGLVAHRAGCAFSRGRLRRRCSGLGGRRCSGPLSSTRRAKSQTLRS